MSKRIRTYIVEFYYDHETVKPTYGVVELDHRKANILQELFQIMDEAKNEQDQLREMVYSSHMVTWVEFSELSDFIETGVDVITGQPMDEALSDNLVVAVDTELNVDMCRGVEVEMLHIKPSSLMFSAYVDGWGDGIETGEIPRSEIRELARTLNFNGETQNERT